MAFLYNNDPGKEKNNRAFGRGLFTIDPEEAQKKAKSQKQYQRQLQLQVQQAKQKKKDEQQKIRREDEKWQREIDELAKAEKEKGKKQNPSKNQPNSPNEYKPKALEESNSYHYNKNTKKNSLPFLPLDFSAPADPDQGKPLKTETPQYLQPSHNEYYHSQLLEQRIYKHKEELDAKVEQIFGHIKSSKEALKTQDELERIRMKIYKSRGKRQQPMIEDYEQQQFSKFYSIPKKSNPYESNFRNLDKQSYSKYKRSSYQNKQRSPISTPYIERNEFEKIEEEERGRNSRWGQRAGRQNYLSNREALDYQIDSLMGRIDNLLHQ